MRKLSIAVLGAGLIGRQHVQRIVHEAHLAAVVDPDTSAQTFATAHGAAWFPDLAAMLACQRPDGVVIATPNQLHVEHGLACIDAGLPILIEKPISDDVVGARKLVAAGEAAGVPILVGHHRRHNPLIRRAKAEIDSGRLGKIVSVQMTCWFYKPDTYFEAVWRRQPGGGPLFINLIHDIDLARYLCGDVVAVQAQASNAIRGYAVEDTAAILLTFRSGALGVITVSDTIVAPWSWEMTAGENARYPKTGEACYRIGGSQGSLSIPDLTRWHYAGARDWQTPIARHVDVFEEADPLALQIRHFMDVIARRGPPLVTGRDGLAALETVVAIKSAAKTGRLVEIEGSAETGRAPP